MRGNAPKFENSEKSCIDAKTTVEVRIRTSWDVGTLRHLKTVKRGVKLLHLDQPQAENHS